MGAAARSRPRAEGCNLTLLESRPIRSAAGILRRINRTVIGGPPPPGSCGLLRFRAEPPIQDSKFKIQN